MAKLIVKMKKERACISKYKPFLLIHQLKRYIPFKFKDGAQCKSLTNNIDGINYFLQE